MGDRLTLAIDFHGVICSYKTGYKRGLVADDPPTPGAFKFLLRASQEYDIAITSASFGHPGQAARGAIDECLDWFRAHGFPADLISGVPGMPPIYLTPKKPRAHLIIDDRGWCFDGSFPDLDTIRDFRPWNRRG